MEPLGKINDQMRGLVFDIDDTLYPRSPDYRRHVMECEIILMAQKKGIDKIEAERLLNSERAKLTRAQGREVTMTEVFYVLGFGKDELQAGRGSLWQPEQYLKPNPQLHLVFRLLFPQFRIAFGTNSPRRIGERILRLLGLDTIGPELMICGPESFSFQKPASEFFTEIARALGLEPSLCLSVGDRKFADGLPAIAAGYGAALIVDDVHELMKLFRQVAERGRLTALLD